MAIEKDEELFKLQEQVEPIEPGSLTTFGNSVKENLTVFGTRIGAIMDGSSDDGWDDKVKTQIKTSMQTIVDAAKEKEKAADHVMGGEGIISTMKYAVNEYKDTFEQYETRLANVPTKTEEYEEDGEKKTRKTQAYKDWEKDIFIFEKAIPELQEQANTWVDQVKAYFSAYDFAKNEVDSNIYKPITDPLVFFGDLKAKYEGDFVEKPLEENEQAEEKSEEEIQETEDAVAAARKKEIDDKTRIAIGELVTEGLDPDSDEFADKLAEKLKEQGLTETEIAAALEAYNKKRNGEEPTTEHDSEDDEDKEPGTEHDSEDDEEQAEPPLDDGDEEDEPLGPVTIVEKDGVREEYDTKGRLVAREEGGRREEYDDMGRLTDVYMESDNGRYGQRTNVHQVYSKDGRVIMETADTEVTGSAQSKGVTRTYNENGTVAQEIVEEWSCDSETDGKITLYNNVDSYDKDGKKIYSSVTHEDGTTRSEYYKYDENGKIKQEYIVTTDADGNETQQLYDVTFDENNKKIKTRVEIPSLSTITKRDDMDRPTQYEWSYVENGEKIKVTQYVEYDQYGKLFSERTVYEGDKGTYETTTYNYQYDEDGKPYKVLAE